MSNIFSKIAINVAQILGILPLTKGGTGRNDGLSAGDLQGILALTKGGTGRNDGLSAGDLQGILAKAKGGTGNAVGDADTTDGKHLPNTIASLLSDHNKAAHDSLGINADTVDLVHINDQSASNYIRIGNMQICWGYSGFLTANTDAGAGKLYYSSVVGLVTFPVAFVAGNPFVMGMTGGVNSLSYVCFLNLTTIGMQLRLISSYQNFQDYVHWIAIGRFI